MTLKELLEQGQYTVDTKKVADAILSSPLLITLLSGDGGGRRGPGSRPVVG